MQIKGMECPFWGWNVHLIILRVLYYIVSGIIPMKAIKEIYHFYADQRNTPSQLNHPMADKDLTD